MDVNKILSADYLDILFEGRNKAYGGYELRKKYPKRMLIAGIIGILAVVIAFAATMINIEPEAEDMGPIKPKEIVMAPPPPLKPNEPPPPPPPPAPPPVKPTVKFTPPVIKPNEEVREEEKPQPPKPEENVDVGKVNIEGSDDPAAVSANLSPVSGTGTAPAVVPPPPPDNKPLRTVQQMPSFPGGGEALRKYLQNNLRYPEAAIDQNIQGTILVEFVVNEDGSVTDVTPLKELGGGCTQEAVRVIKSMPKWNPGKNNGKAVKVYYKVPVTFRLSQ